MKSNFSKGMLMTALITGMFYAAVQLLLPKSCRSIRWTRWL